jgi:ubiquinone/menaquinone biosynthesis C-methylase UbiE
MSPNEMDAAEITRQTYDEIAPGYVKKISDLVCDTWLGKFEKSLLDKFVDLLKASQEGKLNILDIGCGNGKDTYYLSRQDQVNAIGLDYSAGMLKEARKSFPGIDLIQMDMRKLVFPKKYFHGVWANGCVYHVRKKDFGQVLQEIKRVLKPGGIYSFNFKLGAGEQLEGNPRSYGGKPRFYAYYGLDEILDLVQKASFKVIETQPYPEEIFNDKIMHVWISNI